MGRVPAGVLELVGDAPIGKHREAVERERRSGAVAYEALASHVVVGADPHGHVQVESLERHRRATHASRLVLIGTAIVGVAVEVVEQSLLDGYSRTPHERVGIEVLLSAEWMAREPAGDAGLHVQEDGHQVGLGGRETWTCRFSESPKRWTNVTAPARPSFGPTARCIQRSTAR